MHGITLVSMLVGREPEQHRISALVAGARVRHSGVLVLLGEAGIGKTALLDHAAELGADMRVLRVSGSEHESGLGFAGLHQLLGPAAKLIERIPPPQADALSVALTLRDGPAPERFAVSAAALTLLSRFAEDHPVLVLVDDAHLLDSPSAEAIAFVARRLIADPVAVLVALRCEPDAVLYDTGLPTIALGGLDLPAATALVAHTTGVQPSHDHAELLHRTTEGNPLALVELACDVERLDHTTPEVPIPVPETVARTFSRRVSGLTESAQRAVLLAAIADGDLTVAGAAALRLGIDASLLVEAEKVGLLALRSDRVQFRHPLVRSAIYAVADPAARRAAHQAVAEALPSAQKDLRTWHLSASRVGSDDVVADALAHSGQGAVARGAHGAAAMAFGRAAELTACHATRCGRFVQAGAAAWMAGQVHYADGLLHRATTAVDDVAMLAEIDGLRGNIALRTGSLRDALHLLVQASDRMAAVDVDRSMLLLADAVTACFYLCDTAAGAAIADTLEERLNGCGSPIAAVRARTAIGMARILAGADGVPWLRHAVASLTADPDRYTDPQRPDWSVIGTLFLRESIAGRELVDRVVSTQRARTALGALPNLLFHTARDDATTDRWRSAEAGFDEAVGLARETGQTTDLAVSLAGLAWLQARMGRLDDCRANRREARELAAEHHIVLAWLWTEFAAGDASLAVGDAIDAARHYRDLYDTMRRIGVRDVDLGPGPELAEALLRVDDLTGAREVADEYLAEAQAKGQSWALARGHRGAALVASDTDEQTARFEQALSFHRDGIDLYEEARTHLAYGAALRRARRRAAARPQLRCALEQFERLGARPWADFAATELNATGEHVRRASERYQATLTPQEIRISALLANGRTTKEAAAELFLSPKTIEYHLRRIYQKLGVNSRSELAAMISASG